MPGSTFLYVKKNNFCWKRKHLYVFVLILQTKSRYIKTLAHVNDSFIPSPNFKEHTTSPNINTQWSNICKYSSRCWYVDSKISKIIFICTILKITFPLRQLLQVTYYISVAQADITSDVTHGNSSIHSGDALRGRTEKNEMIHATLPFVLRSAGFIECEGANPTTAGSFFSRILGPKVNYTQSDYLCGPTCQGTFYRLVLSEFIHRYCSNEHVMTFNLNLFFFSTGKCIPRPSDVGIPSDNLPYGCKCSTQGCDLNGPVVSFPTETIRDVEKSVNVIVLAFSVKVSPMDRPFFKMICQIDVRCTCFGMGPGQYNGYSCQWINTVSGFPITFTEKSVMLPGTHGHGPVLLPAKGGHRFSPIKWCSCCPRLPQWWINNLVYNITMW